MIKNKEILKHNIFSYIMPEDTIFYSHEWLAEILIYLSKKFFKIDIAYLYISILLVFIVFFKFLYEKIKDKSIFSIIFVSILILLSFSIRILSERYLITFLITF